jgi:hypothetical protein
MHVKLVIACTSSYVVVHVVSTRSGLLNLFTFRDKFGTNTTIDGFSKILLCRSFLLIKILLIERLQLTLGQNIIWLPVLGNSTISKGGDNI